jgi:hypothetical protein
MTPDRFLRRMQGELERRRAAKSCGAMWLSDAALDAAARGETPRPVHLDVCLPCLAAYAQALKRRDDAVRSAPRGIDPPGP